MNISAFFVHRPIGTILLALGIALFGGVAFHFLPVSILPQIEFPTISVSSALPGANPEIMATSVATPLERRLGQISGVTEITSVSKSGSMRITLQFDLNRDINGAARDVQAAILAARSELPRNLPSQPNYRIVNPADAPIMVIALTSPTLTSGQIYDVASSILQQKFSQVDGVGQVIVGGSSLPAVRVELNPDALSHHNISFDEVRTALAQTNVNQPKGQIQSQTYAWDILTNDQLFKAKDYEPLIVSYRNNAPIRIKDIGNVTDSVEDVRNSGISDGKPSVVLVIFKQPGVNIIETVERLYDALETIKRSVPRAIDLTVAMDRTETIRQSLHDVEITLLLSIFLVIGVMYIFLGSLRAALIPSIVIPLTLLGTFGVMYLCGFSLNNLSLMALTISTGFIVDDAVVVLENIERHIESGISPMIAALKGAKEVGFTVLSMSTSLIAVFIPVLLMEGIIGRLFREFALTLSISILVSLVVSLTMTPLMCSRILKGRHPQTFPPKEVFIDRVRAFYQRSLGKALRHQPLMLGVMILTLLLTVYLFTVIPKGFFPLQDTGRIMCSIQTQQDMSFTELQKKLHHFVDIIKKDPAIAHVAGYIGGANAIGNAGSLFIALKPQDQRDVTAFDVINRLRRQISFISGATLYMQASQDLVIGGRSGNSLFQYTLSAYDLAVLNKWVPLVQEKVSKIPGVVDLNSDQLNRGLDMNLTYNRDTLARFNVTTQQADAALYSAFGQRQVSTFYTPMNQYHVVMEVAPKYWHFPDTLKKIFVTNTEGKSIPLSVLAQIQRSSTLLNVTHQGQFPSATLSFNLAPGFALGEVVEKMTQTIEEMKLPISQIQGKFQGTALAFQQSLASEPYLVLAAIFVIYIVLGILYESTFHPLTILSTLPSAGVGALLALMAARIELSVMGLIGILLLIGIVKKNAIMMIDFAIDIQRHKKKSSLAAIYQACLLRFRPIMMTTVAALFGAIPIVLESGVGSELRKPLGMSIIGGLVLSQLLTLYTTPVMYLSLEKASQAWKKFYKRVVLNSQRSLIGVKNESAH